MRKPGHGDIVVFRSPFYRTPNALPRALDPLVFTLSLGFMSLDPQPKYNVKRCLGLPEDRVETVGKRVYISGTPQKGSRPELHEDPRR